MLSRSGPPCRRDGSAGFDTRRESSTRTAPLMHPLTPRHRCWWRAIVLAGLLLSITTDRPARARLPKVPDGFKIRLVAAVPAVQYPCQVATAPDGSLFVGEDPMDQVGPA